MSTWPALILDRDGVINVDHGYVIRLQDFEFIDGIFDLCRAAHRCGYKLIVATNQSGVGRGMFSESDLLQLHAWMSTRFSAEGAALDGIYWCGFHPEHGVGPWRQQSRLRKPAPGMLLQAAQDHDLDLGASINVGDRERDMLAGREAGVVTNLLFRPVTAGLQRSEPTETASAVVTQLRDAIAFLKPHPAHSINEGNPS